MADLGDVFRRLEAAEGAMSLLYAWYASIFADDAEAASFFSRLSDEERGHGDLARFQRNLVVKSRTTFRGVDVDVAEIDGVLEAVGAFRRDHPKPTLGEAIAFAMRQERSHAEHLTRRALGEADESLAALVRNLAGKDQMHYARLGEFAEKRGARLPAELQDY